MNDFTKESVGIYLFLSMIFGVRPKTSQLTIRLGLALVVYLLALCLRVVGISGPAMQGDELLWLERSELLIEQLKTKQYSRATTHLKHPGIPPAVVLGVSQEIAKGYNARRLFEKKDPGYLWPHTAARTANAVVSSLCAPVIYLLGARFVGGPAALLGGLFVAVAPHHIELSRVVHLDGMLSFFVTLTVLLYAHAVLRGSTALKLLSGFTWGLCIATKPTAAALIPAFLVYRFLRWFWNREIERRDRFPLSWNDVAAIVVGHLFLAAIYTRLWVHGSHHLGRFLMHSPLATGIYQFGLSLGEHHSLIKAISLSVPFICLLFALFTRGLAQRVFRHLSWFTVLSAVVVGFYASFPQVVENTARYWLFAAGLSKEVHVGGWGVWRPPPFGYLEFFFRKLPTYALLGGAISLYFLARGVFKKRYVQHLERYSFVLLCMSAIILWVAPLNITSKQDFRYAIPVVPLCYLFIAIGYFCLWKAAAVYFAKHRRPALSRAIVTASPLMIALTALSVVYMSYPHYSLHFSAVSGGLRAAKERRIKFPLVSHREALQFLHDTALQQQAVRAVQVVGEVPETVIKTYQTMYIPEERMLQVHNYFYPVAYDYVILFGAYPENVTELEKEYAAFAGLQQVHNMQWEGVEVLRIYQVNPPAFQQSYELPVALAHTPVGGRRRVSGTKVLDANLKKKNADIVVLGLPGAHQAGYLLAGLRTRVAAGSYRVRFQIARPKDVPLTVGSERYALRLDFGDCSRIVTAAELSEADYRQFTVNCTVSQDTAKMVQAYWFGTVPVLVRKIEIIQSANPAESASLSE